MTRSRRSSLLALALLAAACGVNRPDPTAVTDMRVLGISVSPPELLIAPCDPRVLVALGGVGDAGTSLDAGLPPVDPATLARLLAVAARPVQYRALIADPDGGAGQMSWRLLGCPSTNLARCVNGDFGTMPELASGRTRAGELTVTTLPALTVMPGDAGTPLLLSVIQQDTYKGLGGIRVPLVLDLTSADGAQHVYAQKLMVYTCQIFPTQKQNVLPVIPDPGLLWLPPDGGAEPWPEGEVKTWQGTQELVLQPPDFTALEEAYVVPSLSLQPVNLQESWELTWLTDSGTMRSFSTGGTNLAGVTSRNRNAWRPDGHATEARRVTLWVVAQDGRGGESWISRQVDWAP